jgi:LysM repeat protein
MRKMACVAVIMGLAILISGCVTVEKVVRERVDQDTSGNRGYLQGSGPAPSTSRATDREYIDVRVEVPTLSEIEKHISKNTEGAGVNRKSRSSDKALLGNRGYISGSGGGEIELPEYKTTADAGYQEPEQEYEYKETEEVTIPKANTYKVKAGDSLSKIAKQMYGKSSKWTVIYEVNSDKIKDPNKLKTGMVLTIPPIEEVELEIDKKNIK